MEEEKIFDVWNGKKKSINKTQFTNFYKEREIWWCNLGKNIGSEQDGKGDNYERPILIIKAFSRSVCLIVPLTTSKRSNPYYFKIGLVEDKEASLVISQIRLIDTKRLINKIGIQDVIIFDEVRKTIRNLF